MGEIEKAQWGNPVEFILSIIGCAIGLGNVWRFPYLVFSNKGGPFLVPFIIFLFIIGIPIFFLETAVGQFSGLSPAEAYYNMVPLFQGIGYACVFVNSMIGFYYNVIIAYLLHYFIMSFRANLRWADCDNSAASDSGIVCYKRTNYSTNLTECQAEKEQFAKLNNVSLSSLKSPSEVYFYGPLLGLSDGIENLGAPQWELTLALIACWLIVFLVLCKGVQILGKVSYFTATFPYVMMTILVVAGALLDGAGKGVSFYLLGPTGEFQFKEMFKPKLIKDAAGQIFFGLSSCTGALIAMSSFSNFDNNLIRDAFLVPVLDIATGFYAGFAIFTVLGYMYISKCASDFSEVAAGGPELAFIVYPEGLSLMGKVGGPIFSVLFFFMMLALGFGSEFGIMETTMTTVIDRIRFLVDTKKKEYITRGIICLTYLGFGLILVTKGGFFVLNLIDEKVGGIPLIMIGLFQVICVAWFYGPQKFAGDIEQMVGKKHKVFWIIFQASWMVITPVVLIFIIIFDYVTTRKPLVTKNIQFPDYAEGIGYVFEFIPLTIIVVCAIYQTIKHIREHRIRDLIKPRNDYYRKRDRFLQKQKEESSKKELNQDELLLEDNSYQKMHDKNKVDTGKIAEAANTIKVAFSKANHVYPNDYVSERTESTKF